MVVDARQPGEGEPQEMAVKTDIVPEQAPAEAVTVSPFEQLLERMALQKSEAIVSLVDDEKALRVMLGRALTRALGVATYTAEHGEEGLDLIQQSQGKLCLVVTDINMPKMSGAKMIHKARDKGLIENTPVVFMSGLIQQNAAEIANATTGGISHEILQKPFGIDVLVAAIQSACQKVLDKMENASA